MVFKCTNAQTITNTISVFIDDMLRPGQLIAALAALYCQHTPTSAEFYEFVSDAYKISRSSSECRSHFVYRTLYINC